MSQTKIWPPDYFRIQEFRNLFRDFDGWIRSRLRSTQLKKWKRPRKFQRIMMKSGFNPQEAHRVWIKMNKWQSVSRKEVRFVMNLGWFRRQGLAFLKDFTKNFPEQTLFSCWSRSGLPGRYEPFCREGVVAKGPLLPRIATTGLPAVFLEGLPVGLHRRHR